MFPEKELKIIDYIDYDAIEEDLSGKDLVFYDQHHGTAYRLKRAKTKDIRRLLQSLYKPVVFIL